jgi:hypothetical protein
VQKSATSAVAAAAARAIILRDIDGSAKKRVNCVFQLMNAMYAVANPWAPLIVNSVALHWIFGHAENGRMRNDINSS